MCELHAAQEGSSLGAVLCAHSFGGYRLGNQRVGQNARTLNDKVKGL
jgi:hypothetical protein